LPQSGKTEFFKLLNLNLLFYSRVIACSGQASIQTPQSMQASGSTFAFSPAMLIASLGHSETQVSQPVHFPLLTFAGIYIILSKNTTLLLNYITSASILETECYKIIAILQPNFSKKSIWNAHNFQKITSKDVKTCLSYSCHAE